MAFLHPRRIAVGWRLRNDELPGKSAPGSATPALGAPKCQFPGLSAAQRALCDLQPGDPTTPSRMRLRGFEPPRAHAHTDLNRACIPVSPQPLVSAQISNQEAMPRPRRASRLVSRSRVDAHESQHGAEIGCGGPRGGWIRRSIQNGERIPERCRPVGDGGRAPAGRSARARPRSSSASPIQARPSRSTLYVLGDSGVVAVPTPQLLVVHAMVKSAAQDDPALLLHVGDAVYFGGRLAGRTTQFYEPLTSLQLAVCGWPGNHDEAWGPDPPFPDVATQRPLGQHAHRVAARCGTPTHSSNIGITPRRCRTATGC